MRYKNNIAVVKVGNEVSSWYCIKLGVEQSCILSPFMWIILMIFVGAQQRQWTIRNEMMK